MDDVVAQRKSQPGTLARGFGGEKWPEYLGLYLVGYARAVVPNPDFHPIGQHL